MKILFVIYSIYGGGAEKQMQEILRRIDRSKFEPHLAVFELSGKESSVLPQDVTLYDLRTPFRPASLFLALKLARLIDKIKPDKVLSFLWSVNLIALSAGMISRHHPQIFVSERTLPSESVLRYRFSYIRGLLIKIIYPGASKIAAVSRNVKNDLIERFGVPAEKIAVIYNSIDLEKIRSAMKEEIDLKPPFLISAGGLNPTKNFEFQIRAFVKLKAARPGLKLVILGEGALRQKLEELIKELKLDGSVLMPGYVGNPHKYFSRASCFILSSHFEGFPNVVPEAMACGTPVVLADQLLGARELVEDRVTGLVYARDNPDSLVSSVEALLNDPALARQLSDNALARVKKDLDINKMVRNYEDLFSLS
jgi:N-acetylgalactosamine-N,N'-diacetylbacillosaminyl-diphospho-undecaprenol 4-alpha-N-acetylgalactosaminyltransferase